VPNYTTEQIAELTTPHHPADWTELDSRAVDTARMLAADAVQKVGNGHPGTAMSLAPAAYLFFQKVMRHNPADPHWPGRDRFVLSCGHSSLTLYLQLFLGGWGLELDDIKAGVESRGRGLAVFFYVRSRRSPKGEGGAGTYQGGAVAPRIARQDKYDAYHRQGQVVQQRQGLRFHRT
jgi:hypothetical protein